MEKIKQEDLLLKTIKYGPILFVLIASFVFTNILLNEKKDDFKNNIKHIEQTFLENNKNRINEEVREVYDFILNEKSNSEKLLKESIKNRVYEAHQIATNINNGERSFGHVHSDEHIMESIKNALSGIIYNNGRGYIFMGDMNGTKLLQPFNKEFEGKNLYNYKDAKGYQFVKKIVQTINDKTEAYDSYYWYKADDKVTAYKKISFYKYFEPFNVAIGTGEYVDDFEKELKEKVINKIRDIRYGHKGYIFVYDLEGNCLSHYNKELIGKNRMNYQDKDGKFVLKDIIDFTKKNKEGFLSYISSVKPITEISTSSKISYLKLFEDWGWVIGTGFYTDALNNQIENRKKELEKSNKEALENIVYFSLLITLVFIGVSFLISTFIKRRFETYQKNLEKEIENKIEKEKLLLQQSKMASMGEMLSNIAHQWRQPLSIISTSSTGARMQKEMNSLTDEQLDSALVTINNSAQYLSQTIDDFRSFFVPSNQKTNEFNISDAITKTFNIIDAQFKAKEIEIIENIENIKLLSIENELMQVLINILNNARDILLGTNNQRKLIFMDVFKENNKLIIEIKDNGNGISLDVIDRVFEPYFTTKDKLQGTGIGLYMSEEIIRVHLNGAISVSNEKYLYEGLEYTGAKFRIEIPINLE